LNRATSHAAAERHPSRSCRPRRSISASPADPFDLELLDGAVQLGEVLLDPRVRQIRQRLGSQRVHRGT
jgi:hypothetical protein